MVHYAMSQTISVREYFNALMSILEEHYVCKERVNESSAWNFFKDIADDCEDKGTRLHWATGHTVWAFDDNHVGFIGPWVKFDSVKGPAPLPEGGMEAGNIAYISLPGTSAEHRKTGDYIRRGNEILHTALAQNPLGAIIDLRQNTGGDCWQMIAAVAPLLDKDNCELYQGKWPENRNYQMGS